MPARNYEPAALSRGESADVLILLMSLPEHSPALRLAIEAGVAMLRQLVRMDVAWCQVDKSQG